MSEKYEVMVNSLLDLRVCSNIPREQIEAVVNTRDHPGTNHGWQLSGTLENGDSDEVQCLDHEDCKHFAFRC